MYDFLIVGGGLSGCVLAERIAGKLNKKVLIVERRSHLAGNAYDFVDENGIIIHKYGPHIFHTNSKYIWNYLSAFTKWHNYTHKVMASFDNIKIPIPFNLNSIDICFSNYNGLAEKLKKKLVEFYGLNRRTYILEMLNHQDSDLKFLAHFIYENIFLNYTRKQWGVKPEELYSSVTSRLPVFIGSDDRYFKDVYQGIPLQGYTKLVERMVSHKNITIITDTDFRNIGQSIKFNKMIYTGAIDQFFDYQFGELQYRSLSFDKRKINAEVFQETGQINFTKDEEFTRIIEFKHITGQKSPDTVISFEYPQPYVKSINEPYYPIPKAENSQIFNNYREHASKLRSVVFCGRLADYKYYNMDQVIARALYIFKSQISKI